MHVYCNLYFRSENQMHKNRRIRLWPPISVTLRPNNTFKTLTQANQAADQDADDRRVEPPRMDRFVPPNGELWTDDENRRLAEAVGTFGRRWKEIKKKDAVFLLGPKRAKIMRLRVPNNFRPYRAYFEAK